MSLLWLANADPATAWAHQTWSDLSARIDKPRTVVVLPVHGFADHGMGLPLDVEELVGSAVLRAAITASPALQPHVLVLPPLRFGAGPYSHCRFGVDAETAADTLNEIVASVHASEFSRILFFNTSPWNAEIVSTAALDARVSVGLAAYVIGSTGIGLGFHPSDANRPRTQAVAARLLGQTDVESSPPADTRDVDFRPGYYGRPHPVALDTFLDADCIFTEAAASLAGLLGEVFAHETNARDPLSTKTPVVIEPTSVPPPSPPPPTAERACSLTALTGEQLAALPNKERALVIIPTAAIEQHGHHLPLGTDAMLAQLWLARALPKLATDAPVFVAPPLTYGKSNEHLGFCGTITVSARTLRRQLLAIAADLKSLGFRQIAVLNTHGGNSPTVVATLREMQTALGLRAGMLRGYHRPEQSPQETAFGFHAGEWETSLMLAGAPELVHMDRAVREYPAEIDAPGKLRPEGAPAVFAWKTNDVSQSGVMGDATLATAEKGMRWLDEASTALARKIESLLAPDPPPSR